METGCARPLFHIFLSALYFSQLSLWMSEHWPGIYKGPQLPRQQPSVHIGWLASCIPQRREAFSWPEWVHWDKDMGKEGFGFSLRLGLAVKTQASGTSSTPYMVNWSAHKSPVISPVPSSILFSSCLSEDKYQRCLVLLYIKVSVSWPGRVYKLSIACQLRLLSPSVYHLLLKSLTLVTPSGCTNID